MLPRMRACLHGLTILLTLAVWPAIAGAQTAAHPRPDSAEVIAASAPDPGLAADLFGLGDKMPRLERQDAPVPRRRGRHADPRPDHRRGTAACPIRAPAAGK